MRLTFSLISGNAQNNYLNRGWHRGAISAFLGTFKGSEWAFDHVTPISRFAPHRALAVGPMPWFPFITGLAIAVMPLGAARAELPPDPLGLAGLYGGSHICENGEHGALLEITRVIAGDTPDYPYRLQGRYAFFPLTGGRAGIYGEIAGSFRLVGEIREDGHVTLDSLGWLVAPPEGQGAGDIEGRFSARADGLMQFEGRMDTGVPDECGAVLLTRALPAPEKDER